MVVKDNHRVLRRKIAAFFSCPDLYEAQFHRATCRTQGHGRVEIRSITTSEAVAQEWTGFAGVRQLFQLERTVCCKRSGKVRQEMVFGMTSLPACQCSASQLSALIRGHWTIENRVHYVRDVTFGEDASVVRKGNIAQTLSCFRNMALSLIRLSGFCNVAAARRYFAANPRRALQCMGIQITE